MIGIAKRIHAKQDIADRLEIDVGYVYKLLKGTQPGLRLYRDVIKLYNEVCVDRKGN
jgi:hypothetical protein